MKKSILSLAAAAAISGAFTIPVQAEDVKVKDGDTLWGISQTYKVSVEDIKSWNDLSSDAIYAGETIHISQEEHYKVKSGDTLSGIAHKYDVGVNDIKSWNGLSSDTIHPGQEIVIKPAANKVEAASVGPAQKSEQAAQAEQSEPADSNNESQDQAESGKEITVSATAYTADCQGCSGTTATGVDLKANPDAKVIAVDPSVIPLGSKVYVEGYGYATAADTGSAIKGNRVDIFVPNEQDAVNWGVKDVKVQILN
ncbi:3D domain-containing protein [Peribacillus frigoritolerans]|uniref:3D domain-containing protein n=1 Tax=Peribacillus frigoritolerans TaxID=450367 RepID=UPI00207AB343|nr:LysM peptidoglycan-binding and 3D domain-containing protein [Peribacillus frigoritolerans]USK62733.1 LysM peptidoglycan-binding domain-containing protein [Peribacillus frigoritolerans]